MPNEEPEIPVPFTERLKNLLPDMMLVRRQIINSYLDTPERRMKLFASMAPSLQVIFDHKEETKWTAEYYLGMICEILLHCDGTETLPNFEDEFEAMVKDLVALCPPPNNSPTSSEDLEALLSRPKSEELVPARRWVEVLWTSVGPDWKMAHYSDVCKGLSPVSLMDPGNPPLKLSGRLMIKGQEPVVLYDPQGRVVAIIPRDIYDELCNM
jgi:hypothetical protein